MEPAAAACVPCNFQLASWTREPAAWSPAGFAAVSAEPGEIRGGSWIQTCVPDDSGGGGQLVEYYAAATPTHYPVEKEAQAEPCEVVLRDMEMEAYSHSIHVLFEEAAEKFAGDIDRVKLKIHRYPKSVRDIGDEYTVPRVVSIGPYHHGLKQLQKAEQVKQVAVHHCITESDCWSSPRLQDMYAEVVSAADFARRCRLYDEDVMAGISCDDFRLMMFFDACFLVQYMLWYIHISHESTDVTDPSLRTDPQLRSFFDSHHSDIHHDVWLLENQLPWGVVKAVMKFRHVDLEKFVGPWRHHLQDRQALEDEDFVLEDGYEPPHLLGLLRHYIVGSKERPYRRDDDDLDKLSISMSVIELAQIGITVTADETAKLVDMDLRREDIIFVELSLAPLSLDYARANRLVNMAAFELCTIPSFLDATRFEDSAVCSYLLLLSMLVHKEEDVHELRRQGVLQGGVGLTNKQALEFFTSCQILPEGAGFVNTMVEIERYRLNRKLRTKVLSFYHKNYKTISAIGAGVTIIGTLLSISVKIKSLMPAP